MPTFRVTSTKVGRLEWSATAFMIFNRSTVMHKLIVVILANNFIITETRSRLSGLELVEN